MVELIECWWFRLGTIVIFVVVTTAEMLTEGEATTPSIKALTLSECPPGSFLAVEASLSGNLTTICRTCAVCPPGYENTAPCTVQANATCSACAERHFSAGNGSNCTRCSTCPAGTFTQRECTSGTDTVCVPCKPGTFSHGKDESKGCTPCKVCSAGKYEKRKCNRKRNTKCEGCRGNSFSPDGKGCRVCMQCLSGFGQARKCSKAKDATCEMCSPGSFSPGGEEKCQSCSVCDQTQTLVSNCSMSSDTVCYPCLAGFFFNNVTGSCQACSTCEAGHVVQEECGLTSDVVCSECPPETYSCHQGTQCHACSTCKSGWRQARKCTRSKDTRCERCEVGTFLSEDGRECQQCSYCPAGMETKRSCSRHRDTVCRKCSRGMYSPGYGFACRLCALCRPGTYVDRACSRRKDTVCKPCDEGSFMDVWSQSSECKKCRTCPKNQAVKVDCRYDTDTQCGYCSQGQFVDEHTKGCLKCSYCYPEHPDLGVVREDGCWRLARQWQCRPLAYTPSINLTEILTLNLTEPPWQSSLSNDDQDVIRPNIPNQAQSIPTTARSGQARNALYSNDDEKDSVSSVAFDSQDSMTQLVVIIVPTSVAIIVICTIFILTWMVCIKSRRQPLFSNSYSSKRRLQSLSAPPSSVDRSSNVKLWLAKQPQNGEKIFVTFSQPPRHSWPTIPVGDLIDCEDRISIVSYSVLSREGYQRKLEERMSDACRLYLKPPLHVSSENGSYLSNSEEDSLTNPAVI